MDNTHSKMVSKYSQEEDESDVVMPVRRRAWRVPETPHSQAEQTSDRERRQGTEAGLSKSETDNDMTPQGSVASVVSVEDTASVGASDRPTEESQSHQRVSRSRGEQTSQHTEDADVEDSGDSDEEVEGDPLGGKSVAGAWQESNDELLSDALADDASMGASSQDSVRMADARFEEWQTEDADQHEALKEHPTVFLRHIWHKEKNSGRNTLTGMRQSDWMFHSGNIIATMKACMLQGLVEGTLSRRKAQKNPELLKVVQDHSKRLLAPKTNFPLVYLLELVDSDGEPPTPHEYEEALIQRLERYEEDADRAYILDTVFSKREWSLQRNVRGERRYLQPSPDQNKARKEDADKRKKSSRRSKYSEYGIVAYLEPSESKIQHFRQYCEALRHRLRLLPDDQEHKPMRPVQCYVGFTSDPTMRIKAHESHLANSNYLLSLTLAALMDLFPARGFHTEVFLHPIFEREQSIVGEVLFASIRNSFHNTGRGFNIDDPGRSNQGGCNLDPENEGLLMEYAQKHTDLDANIHEWTLWLQHKQEQVEQLDSEERIAEELERMADDPEVLRDHSRSIANEAMIKVVEEATAALEEAEAAIRSRQDEDMLLNPE